MTNLPFPRVFLFLNLLAFVALVGCQSKAPNTAQPGQSAGASKTDYSSVGSKLLKNEGLGPVRIGAKSDEVVKALGAPESKSQTGVSEVDAKPHQQWTYAKQGVVLDMVTESGEQEVAMITVSAPSTLKTKRGVGIGSTTDAVTGAYAAEIDPSANDPQSIVAGTVYGGLSFGLENGRVTSIVLGAVAE